MSREDVNYLYWVVLMLFAFALVLVDSVILWGM